MTDPNECRLIDTTSAIDIGQGYSLAWVVDVDGMTWPVLYDTRHREPQSLPHLTEHFRALAPHELTGRLPDTFQQFRCGARTHNGKPCRSRVTRPGLRCAHHREATVAPPRIEATQQQALFNLDEPGRS